MTRWEEGSGPDPVTRAPDASRRRLWVAAGTGVLALGLVAAGATWFVPWWSDANRPPTHQRVAAGRAHTCAITPGGTVKCWGDNTSGQLGDGTTTSTTTPVEVRDLTNVVALSGSGNDTCALTASGTVSCWGANDAGQLGDGGTASSTVPVAVAEVGQGVLAISAGATHTCALTRARAVWCWGDNGSGQLGTGVPAAGSGPREVAGLPARSTGVAAGNGFTCVVFTGRTVRCWGDNGDGQLGLGDTRPRATWETVVGLPPASFVSAGDAHTCALAHDGRVLCWGANFAGQLGATSSARNAFTPMAVPGIGGGFTVVASGYNQTCAVGGSGEVSCWGGARDASVDAGPVTVQGLPPSRDVSVGAFHACAVSDAEVWCWGRNPSGQLGDGSESDHAAPVRVVGF